MGWTFYTDPSLITTYADEKAETTRFRWLLCMELWIRLDQ